MENTVKVTLKPGAKAPVFKGSTIEFRIHSFIKLYKGKVEKEAKLLNTNGPEGHFTIRPFERILVGTGTFMDLPKGQVLKILNRPGFVIRKGASVMESVVDETIKTEICILLCNTCQYLVKLEKGDIIAKGIFLQTMEPELQIVE